MDETILDMKVPTSFNITLRLKQLLKKYPQFKASEWLRDNLTEEVIKECIKEGKYVYKKVLIEENRENES